MGNTLAAFFPCFPLQWNCRGSIKVKKKKHLLGACFISLLVIWEYQKSIRHSAYYPSETYIPVAEIR